MTSASAAISTPAPSRCCPSPRPATSASSCADQGVGGEAAFRQWFHFRLHGAAGRTCGWSSRTPPPRLTRRLAGYRCVASYDRRHWFRIGTTRYEDGRLIVEHRPERNSIYYAYFEP